MIPDSPIDFLMVMAENFAPIPFPIWVFYQDPSHVDFIIVCELASRSMKVAAFAAK